MLLNPAYRIDLYNHDNELIYVLSHEGILSLSYEIEVNKVSTFTFVVKSDHPVYGQLEDDDVAVVSRFDPLLNTWYVEHCYLIGLTEAFQDETGAEYMLYGGLSCEDILERVVVDPDDDPTNTPDNSGYSTKDGSPETMMHEYVDEQRGASASAARSIPELTQVGDLGRGTATGLHLRHENLLEVLQTLALQGIDFWMDYVGNQGLVFTTGIRGEDKRRHTDSSNYLFFSKSRGNMIAPTSTYDTRKSKNVCYALGAGQGAHREVYKITTSATLETPYARREFVHNSGSNEPGAALEILTEATKEIEDRRPERTLTFKLGDNARYRTHWNLGDYCTAEYAGREDDYRIVKISVKVQGVKEEIVPSLESVR